MNSEKQKVETTNEKILLMQNTKLQSQIIKMKSLLLDQALQIDNLKNSLEKYQKNPIEVDSNLSKIS